MSWMVSNFLRFTGAAIIQANWDHSQLGPDQCWTGLVELQSGIHCRMSSLWPALAVMALMSWVKLSFCSLVTVRILVVGDLVMEMPLAFKGLWLWTLLEIPIACHLLVDIPSLTVCNHGPPHLLGRCKWNSILPIHLLNYSNLIMQGNHW